ncbi:uncharacterized protein J7T54_005360 [Emericellopsis cladophorae]|uniref:Uncharacterized protein n=1 Tax=Emericellopsis cladophorae TaxID=2686198 RepID=A0A9P9XW52_9HYPO|nr:uncharacterized protein J7T54_005360 [Emericellopsis cladophorae]KAI6778454.1 hypothetical protein J7T54_005360 [Emericellopsis cladophorae]
MKPSSMKPSSMKPSSMKPSSMKPSSMKQTKHQYLLSIQETAEESLKLSAPVFNLNCGGNCGLGGAVGESGFGATGGNGGGGRGGRDRITKSAMKCRKLSLL